MPTLMARRSRRMVASTVRELDVEIGAPDTVEELAAAEDAARVLEEMAQQAKLGGREMDLALAAKDAVRGKIHPEIVELQHVLGEGRDAPGAARRGCGPPARPARRAW